MPQNNPRDFSTHDIAYHRPDGAPLLARLYQPAGHGPFPAVVDVHGGRWCAETRLTNAAIDEALAASGIVVMAIDFRMPPEVKFPIPVADINFAIRWLHAHAAEFKVDRLWIGGLGTSSGGHQILLNALNPLDPRFAQQHDEVMKDVDPALSFVVACWPVSDPPVRYHYALDRNMEIHVRSHEAYWADETEMQNGSPQRIVTEGMAARLPPLLVIQGADDVILSPDMSERFVKAYSAAGGEVRLERFAGEGHTFITKNPTTAASRKAVNIICDFIHDKTDGSAAV